MEFLEDLLYGTGLCSESVCLFVCFFCGAAVSYNEILCVFFFLSLGMRTGKITTTQLLLLLVVLLPPLLSMALTYNDTHICNDHHVLGLSVYCTIPYDTSSVFVLL